MNQFVQVHEGHVWIVLDLNHAQLSMDYLSRWATSDFVPRNPNSHVYGLLGQKGLHQA